MTTEELQINNLLLDSCNRIIKVRGFDETSIDYSDFNTGGFSALPSEHCKPIPLAYDWLDKFEFESFPHFTITNSRFIDLARNRRLDISCVGTPNLAVWLQEIEDNKINELICLHNYDYDGKMYVHQLQNLYFWLSNGKQLKVK